MTLKEGDVIGVVVNPSHAQTRQCNNLMHELAHIELKHVPTRVDISATGSLLLSDYSEDQEQEADWLAGALLLPRTTLLTLRGRGRTIEQIAVAYGVSTALCDWRLKMTGVDHQLRRSAR
jgi:Zn-dependent peptidase ImmA (M78 family)